MSKVIFLFLLLWSSSLFSQNLDFRILHSINSLQPISSDGFFRLVSNSDIYIVAAIPATMAVVGLIKHNNKLLKNSGVVAVSSVVNFGVTFTLKYAVNRQRPFRKYPGIIVNKSMYSINDPSFPSGHTSSAFGAATSLSLLYPKWYVIIPSYAWAGTVAYSRMDLGVHYPSDVFAGALIGTSSAYLTYKINKKLK